MTGADEYDLIGETDLMNLPNKLTILRVIMIPFFVFFMLTDVGGSAEQMDCTGIICCGQSDRSAGWKDRKKI